MSEKKYIGSAKKNDKYGFIKVNVSLADLADHVGGKVVKKNGKIYIEVDPKASPAIFESDNTGKCYLNINVSERRNPDNYGNTHSVTLDEFVPDKSYQKASQKVEEDEDDIPF